MGFVKLTCPGCGSPIELDDSREFGFCSYCGTKVVQDRIVVEHQGSVKVDNSEMVQKFLLNAHRALQKEDWEETEKYYNLVEQNVPDSMEAVFFSSYGKAMLSLTDSDYFKREQKFKVLNRSISVISDYYETTSENKEEVIRMIDQYIGRMYQTTFVYRSQSLDAEGALNSLTGAVGTRKWCANLFNSTRDAFVNELREISQKHSDAFIRELLDKYTVTKTAADQPKQQESKKSRWVTIGIIAVAVIILLRMCAAFL